MENHNHYTKVSENYKNNYDILFKDNRLLEVKEIIDIFNLNERERNVIVD